MFRVSSEVPENEKSCGYYVEVGPLLYLFGAESL